MKDPLRAISRPCPCCGTNGDSPIEYQSEPAAENALGSLSESEWAGFFKSKVFFSYARCAGCGLLYCPKYFDEASLARLYGWMGDNTAGVPTSSLQKTQAGYFGLVHRRWTGGDYLEIGPDIGLFTRLAAQGKVASKFHLFEPNKAVWPELRLLCENQGQVVLSDDMWTLDGVEDGSIGLAVMIHVLDHLLDPRPYLKSLSKKLKADGVLLIVTHNEKSLLARAFGSRYPIFCLQHPQLFSPATISTLLAKAGLATTSVVRTRNYFPAGYLLKHLLYQFGIDAHRLPHAAPELGLPLGNIATLAKAH